MQLERIEGWKRMLITLMEGGNSLAQACASVGVPMARVYNEQSLDSKFKSQCDSALRYGRGDEDRSGARGETARVGPDNKRGRVIVGGHL